METALQILKPQAMKELFQGKSFESFLPMLLYMVYQLQQLKFTMHTYKFQPWRSTTLSVVLNSVLKILERKPSSQEPYMVANVLEETSGTNLESA